MTKDAIAHIQKLYLDGKSDIDFESLSRIGIKERDKEIIIRNLKLKKYWASDSYSISLIDEECDLDGTLIKESSKLFAKLLSIWESGKKKITFDEMKRLNIYTTLTELKIKNLCLNSFPILDDTYSISLIDKSKDPEGKWLDEATTIEIIKKEIEQFIPSSKVIAKESELEKELYQFLKTRFHSVEKQVYIGGVKALKIDLEIAHGKIGIELKMADKLIDPLEKQRFIGQMHDYTTKRYDPGNFMLLVAGQHNYRNDIMIKEVRNYVQDKSHWHFIEL